MIIRSVEQIELSEEKIANVFIDVNVVWNEIVIYRCWTYKQFKAEFNFIHNFQPLFRS